MFNIPTWQIAKTELAEAASSVTLTVDLNNVPFEARHLAVRINAQGTQAAVYTAIAVRLNGDTGANYNRQALGAESSTSFTARYNAETSFATLFYASAASSADEEFSGGELLFPDAFSTRTHKSMLAYGGSNEDLIRIDGGRWANTAAITSVTILPGSGNFVAGSTFELSVVDESFNISEQILGADGQFTISGISAADGDLVQIGNLRSERSLSIDSVSIELNGDSTATNYNLQILGGYVSTKYAATANNNLTASAGTAANLAVANAFGAVILQYPNYSDGSNDRNIISMGGVHGSPTRTYGAECAMVSYRWNNTAAITQIKAKPGNSTNWLTNSMLSTYLVPKNLIERQELSGTAASVTFDYIPQTYDHLELIVYARTDRSAANDVVKMEFNGDTTTTNYDHQEIQGSSTTVSSNTDGNNNRIGVFPAATEGANEFGVATVTTYNYTKTDRHKHTMVTMGTTERVLSYSKRWENTAAITQIVVKPNTGPNFIAGSTFELRGIRAEQNPASNFNVPSIPSQNGDLVLIGNLRTNRNDYPYDGTEMEFNGDTTATNYSRQLLNGFTSSVASVAQDNNRFGEVTCASAVRDAFSPMLGQLTNYSDGSNDRVATGLTGFHSNSTMAQIQINTLRRNNTAATTSVDFKAQVGDGFDAGSMLSSYLVPKNLIERVELGSAANITFSNIPQSYDHLELAVYARSDVSGTVKQYGVQFNGDTTASNYERQTFSANSTTVAAFQHSSPVPGIIPGATSTANVFGAQTIGIQNYALGDRHKSVIILGGYTTRPEVQLSSGRWKNTDPITSIQLICDGSDEFEVGTVVELRGIRTETNAGATFDLQGLPQLEGDILVIGNVRSDKATGASDDVQFRLNSDTGSNYQKQNVRGESSSTVAYAESGSSSVGAHKVSGDSATKHAFGAFVDSIGNSAEGVNDPAGIGLGGFHGDSSNSRVNATAWRRNNVEPVTSWQIFPNVGTNWVPGSMLSAYHIPKNVIAVKKVETASETVTFSDLPQDYQHLKFSLYVATTEAISDERGITVQFNGDTGSNYSTQRLDGAGSGVSAASTTSTGLINALADTGTNSANVFSSNTGLIQNYTKTDRHKQVLVTAGVSTGRLRLSSSRWANTSAVTSITFTQDGSGNFAAGSLFVVEGIGGADYEDNYIRATYAIEVDWNNDGKFDGTGEDITGDTTAVQFDRGRSSNITITALSNTGRMLISVLNDDAKYSPLNSDSAIYPNVVPGRKVRIRETAPQNQTIWQGFVEGIELTQQINGFHRVQIRCTGPFSQIIESEVSYAMQTNILTGTAITQVLDDADWNSTARSIDTGQTTMKRYWTGPKQALTAIREVESAEGGFIREGKVGKIHYEDRYHRLKPPHTDSQSTFSDQIATEPVNYSGIRQLDPAKAIYNVFKSDVILTITGTANQVLWVHPEATAGTLAPAIPAGSALTFWASYPNRSDGINTGQGDFGNSQGIAVHSWATASATLDYIVNASSAGTGANLNGSVSVSTSGFANSHLMTITNTGTTDAWLTRMQLRGTPVLMGDPITVESTGSNSIATYGRRTLPRTISAKFIPNTEEAQQWADARVGVWKDPQGFLQVTIPASKNLYSMVDAVRLDVSDRITIQGTGAGSLGISGDYFIESEMHDIAANRNHLVTYSISPVGGFAGYWVSDISKLAIDTRPYY
tara:strand:+ start:2752 stop:7779 length:5028 start_codon:yes stop_codon:yes gene_type:complete